MSADDTKFIILILSINLLYLQIVCHLFVIGQKMATYHKCNYICFGNLKIPFPQYTLGDSILPMVNRVTDLGVVFASDLKPSVQCSHIAEGFWLSFFVNERFSNF